MLWRYGGRTLCAPTEVECQMRRADEDIRPYEKGKPKGEGDGFVDQILFLRAQKENEVFRKVLCQAFFQESGESGR